LSYNLIQKILFGIVSGNQTTSLEKNELGEFKYINGYCISPENITSVIKEIILSQTKQATDLNILIQNNNTIFSCRIL
jgi:hypothetical protein